MSNNHEMDDEFLSIEDAAEECGMTIEEFLQTIVDAGALRQDADGIYYFTEKGLGPDSPLVPLTANEDKVTVDHN
jgi:hypothetical protein